MKDPYHDEDLGLWKMPKPGNAPPTRDSLPVGPQGEGAAVGPGQTALFDCRGPISVGSRDPRVFALARGGYGPSTLSRTLVSKATIPLPSEQPVDTKEVKPRCGSVCAANFSWMDCDSFVPFGEASVPPSGGCSTEAAFSAQAPPVQGGGNYEWKCRKCDRLFASV